MRDYINEQQLIELTQRIARIEWAFSAYLEGVTDNLAARDAALSILNEE